MTAALVVAVLGWGASLWSWHREHKWWKGHCEELEAQLSGVLDASEQLLRLTQSLSDQNDEHAKMCDELSAMVRKLTGTLS